MDPAASYGTYQARIHARIAGSNGPLASLMEGSPFLWYKCYQRAAKFSVADLEEILLSCADADEATKDGAPLPETLARVVGRMVAQ
jgi:hypothetical protein